MSKMRWWISWLVLVAVAVPLAAAGTAQATLPADQMLLRYVATPDPSFAWTKGPVQQSAQGTVSDLVVTSQTWRGITWRHLVRVFQPKEVAYPGWMALLIAGGSGEPKPGQARGDDALGFVFAREMKAPVAVLSQVPNQPLFGGMTEDAIISYTYQQFIRDGDPTWPLLFPMVKSAVRTMDALQAFSRQGGCPPVSKFMVMGASKRGWTTWLTSVVDKQRVKAIAPMVIDTLNFPAQFRRAVELWGHYSEQVTDYSDKGLTEVFDQPRGRTVWASVDPYTFRQQLVLPKLLVLGANDPYWPTDALNLYWDGLLAPKYVLYAPNSGHGLDDRERVISTICAFFRTVAGGKRMPAMSWERQVSGDQVTLTIKAPAAKGARAWVIKSDDLDFRPDKWESVPMTGSAGTFRVTLARPAGQNLAAYGEADFAADGKPYTLSTQNVILSK